LEAGVRAYGWAKIVPAVTFHILRHTHGYARASARNSGMTLGRPPGLPLSPFLNGRLRILFLAVLSGSGLVSTFCVLTPYYHDQLRRRSLCARLLPGVGVQFKVFSVLGDLLCRIRISFSKLLEKFALMLTSNARMENRVFPREGSLE
jgi:hypothetical protein